MREPVKLNETIINQLIDMKDVASKDKLMVSPMQIIYQGNIDYPKSRSQIEKKDTNKTLDISFDNIMSKKGIDEDSEEMEKVFPKLMPRSKSTVQK